MMYCSEGCRTQALNSYHRTECKLTSFYDREQLDPHEIMAIRALLIGTEQGVELENLMNKLTIHGIFRERVDPRNKPFKTDYTAVLKLSRTFEEPSSRIRLTVWLAVRLVVALQHLSFFKTDEAWSVSFWSIFLTLAYSEFVIFVSL